MSNTELQQILVTELEKRHWTVKDLASESGLPYETTRRAVKGIGNASLAVTNKLLVAVGQELKAAPAQAA